MFFSSHAGPSWGAETQIKWMIAACQRLSEGLPEDGSTSTPANQDSIIAHLYSILDPWQSRVKQFSTAKCHKVGHIGGRIFSCFFFHFYNKKLYKRDSKCSQNLSYQSFSKWKLECFRQHILHFSLKLNYIIMKFFEKKFPKHKINLQHHFNYSTQVSRKS